jgi:crotonobetainyl-CoA:carnitine CoA-transferase CaiB-like acyl-CoA transferase
MFQLLKGLKIIDLTTIVLGPYATQLLADLGAEVIKIESLDGDVFRAVRPGRRDDLGVAFMNFNRNKRSLTLDLKQPRGQEILHALVRDSDALVHNMRARSATKLGASYDTLKEVNPSLVYCYSPGFGSLGPDANAPAYDDIIQSRSGLTDLNANSEGAPQFLRTIAADKVVGLHLALAVASGLIQKERTGKGVCIEAPMLESMVSFLLSEHLAGKTLVPSEGELGYDRMMTPNRKPHKTKDGYLVILPYSTRHWIRFFQLCELEDWATANKVVDPLLRSKHIDELYGKISELAPSKTTAEWLKVLAEQDIPCADVNSLDDIMTDEHLVAAQMFHQDTDPRIGDYLEIRPPFQVDGMLAHEETPNTAAPGLGENNDDILNELGYSAEDINALRQDSVVG